MSNTLKEKQHFENISRAFLSGSSRLDSSIGIISYQEESLQAFSAAHISAFFLKKGKRVSLIDLFADFPNTRCFFQKAGVLKEWKEKEKKDNTQNLSYIDSCYSLQDVMHYLTHSRSYDGSFRDQAGITLLNLPFESSRIFWQVLRMVRFLVILTGTRMSDLLRTSGILKKLSEKKTPFRAGIIFCRPRKKDNPAEIFQKISETLEPCFRPFLFHFGQMSHSQDVFHSLLTGTLINEEELSELRQCMAGMADIMYRNLMSDKEFR